MDSYFAGYVPRQCEECDAEILKGGIFLTKAAWCSEACQEAWLSRLVDKARLADVENQDWAFGEPAAPP